MKKLPLPINENCISNTLIPGFNSIEEIDSLLERCAAEMNLFPFCFM